MMPQLHRELVDSIADGYARSLFGDLRQPIHDNDGNAISEQDVANIIAQACHEAIREVEKL